MYDCFLTVVWPFHPTKVSLRSLSVPYTRVKVSEIAQWVKVLSKTDNVSSINVSSIPPEAIWWERELICTSCPLASIYMPCYAMYTCSVFAHTHNK